MKKLTEYLNMLRESGLCAADNSDSADFDIQISDISYNSLLVREGALFICKGAAFKPEYLEAALAKGAAAFVCEAGSELMNRAETAGADNSGRQLPYIAVSNMRTAISKLSAFYFDRSWDSLKLVGVTGTKGKSTTASMIKAILDVYCGREIGFSSGIYTYDGEHREKARKLTTPETIELHRILDGCVKNDCKYLAMEVSSQALKYDRTLDLNYEVGVFTNISRDHISDAEHKDMEDYFTSKLRIFKQSRVGCINMDMDPAYMPRTLDFARESCERVISFGMHELNGVKPDVYGIKVEEKPGYLFLTAEIFGQCERFRVNIGGSYNAYNALAAIAAATALGAPSDIIAKGLDGVKVMGRMETYSLKDSVDVIVDYAHNKMSYEVLFDYVKKQYPDRRVGFVFGCVGGKAFNRRKEAGEIAEKYADFVIITELDPGLEDINKICNEILSHIEHKEKAEIITDRDTAVRTALDKAAGMENCVLVLAGGSDAYIKRGSKVYEFDTDGERVQKYLAKIKKC